MVPLEGAHMSILPTNQSSLRQEVKSSDFAT